MAKLILKQWSKKKMPLDLVRVQNRIGELHKSLEGSIGFGLFVHLIGSFACALATDSRGLRTPTLKHNISLISCCLCKLRFSFFLLTIRVCFQSMRGLHCLSM